MRDLLLIGAIVIHRPDFLVAAAIADKEDSGFGDSGNASTEAEDNLIGEFVRDQANRAVGCRIAVLFAQDLRRTLILEVVEPSLHRDLVAGRAEVAEGKHRCIWGRRTPGRKIDFRRLPRSL